MITAKNVHQSLKKRVVVFPISALTAGNDALDVPFFIAPCTLEIVKAQIVPQGSASGIDVSNTSEWVVKNGTITLANKTYSNSPPFPNKGVVDALPLTTTIANRKITQGTILTYSITNGTTAATPATLFQFEYVIADDAWDDSVDTTYSAT